MADTSYAPCGDLSLAYQVFGDGPVELVVVGPFVSHIELAWTLPQFKAFVEQLATFCRVALFDKAGVGLSDPVPKVRTLEDRVAEIEAVMDAVGFGQAVVAGLSDGGPVAMMFAATRPERVRALILAGTVPYWGFAGWDDMDRDPAELRARFLAELGEDYTPSIEQLARFQEAGRAVRSRWGSGAAASISAPSVRSIRQLAMCERMSASPGMARASFEAAFRLDVRPILPTLTAPTLVIHAREDLAVPVQGGRYLADHIPGARYLEVEGVDHAPFLTEPDKILTEIEEFLTGSHAAPAQSHRALRTVLFTDIVASTQHAAAVGDERWRAVFHRLGEITADLTERFGGTVVKSTGDGHLTTFEVQRRPSAARKPCAPTPQHWASRSAPASTPASATCWKPTSAESRYTSRRGSSVRPGWAKSLSTARSGTWSSARARASRTAAASSCVVCPAAGSSWRSLATGRGRARPRRNWRQRPPPALAPRCAARIVPWR